MGVLGNCTSVIATPFSEIVGTGLAGEAAVGLLAAAAAAAAAAEGA